MRKGLAVMVALTAVSVAGGAAPKTAALPVLLPVTEKDANIIRDGCESWFTTGETGWLFAAGRDFVVRTASGPSGVHACKMTDAQVQDFGGSATQIACAGLTFSVRQTGKAKGHGEADSADYPALMTVGDGVHTRTLRGRYGTAC